MKYFVYLIIVVLLISGCAVTEVKEPIEPVELTQGSCEAAGGNWNDCGSACRTEPPGTICIEVCVEYCECRLDSECPKGNECIDYVSGVGVCKAIE